MSQYWLASLYVCMHTQKHIHTCTHTHIDTELLSGVRHTVTYQAWSLLGLTFRFQIIYGMTRDYQTMDKIWQVVSGMNTLSDCSDSFEFGVRVCMRVCLWLSLCVCLFVCVCVCASARGFMRAYVCIVFVSLYVCICMYVHVYMRISLCVFVCLFLCMLKQFSNINTLYFCISLH